MFLPFDRRKYPVLPVPRLAQGAVGGVCYHVLHRSNGKRQVSPQTTTTKPFLKPPVTPVLKCSCISLRTGFTQNIFL